MIAIKRSPLFFFSPIPFFSLPHCVFFLLCRDPRRAKPGIFPWRLPHSQERSFFAFPKCRCPPLSWRGDHAQSFRKCPLPQLFLFVTSLPPPLFCFNRPFLILDIPSPTTNEPSLLGRSSFLRASSSPFGGPCGVCTLLPLPFPGRQATFGTDVSLRDPLSFLTLLPL